MENWAGMECCNLLIHNRDQSVSQKVDTTAISTTFPQNCFKGHEISFREGNAKWVNKDKLTV